MVTHKEMPYDQWESIPGHPDHPGRGGTLTHLSKIAEHLKTGDESLRHVAAGRVGPNGPLFKLDGHTRTLGWESGVAPKPTHLEVSILTFTDEEERRAVMWMTFRDFAPAKIDGHTRVFIRE